MNKEEEEERREMAAALRQYYAWRDQTVAAFHTGQPLVFSEPPDEVVLGNLLLEVGWRLLANDEAVGRWADYVAATEPHIRERVALYSSGTRLQALLARGVPILWDNALRAAIRGLEGEGYCDQEVKNSEAYLVLLCQALEHSQLAQPEDLRRILPGREALFRSYLSRLLARAPPQSRLMLLTAINESIGPGSTYVEWLGYRCSPPRSDPIPVAL